jgi:endogenous inhibitor of DNA gyrase (YacG/DUF329 family)
MREHQTEGHYGRPIAIDVCHQCCAIWFDNQELLQLTPAATLQLLADLADVQAGERQALGARMACPRCQRRLVETHDQQQNTKFWYHRCHGGHGRFVTYFQFLRAKNVVRALGDAEIAELRRHIRQINCVNCGAPVEVEKEGICGFCHTPLAILDADQIKTIAAGVRRDLEKAEAGPDPALPISLAMERMRTERAFVEVQDPDGTPALVDLLLGGTGDPLAAVLRTLKRVLR